MKLIKALKGFGLIGGFTSSILFTHVFYKITFEVERYIIICPYGEAPYELVISLFVLIGLILLSIDFIKGKWEV